MRFILCCGFALLLLCTGCKKVIHVNLNDVEKKYVIEGVVTDQPGTCKVLVSQTKNFDDDNSFAGISGAIIQITEQGGVPVLLTETATGVYEAPAVKGTSGKTYSLSVNINGQLFTATSTMPQPVNMDSVFVSSDDVMNKNRKLANVQFKDPPAAGNNYRFVQYVNGVQEKQVFVRNDDLINGNTVVTKLRYGLDDNKDNEINTGDIVKIDMQCIDPAVYKYWYSLNKSATGDASSATPANPVSNLQGDALGYFSAHTLQSKTIVAP
jgi:hypothetical protein